MGFGNIPGQLSSQSPIQIRDALETLVGGDRLDANAVKNLPSTGGGLSAWQLKTSDYTAVAGDRLRIDATIGDVIITLPITPSPVDADIWIQRLDLSTNKVLLRSGVNKFNTQSNKDGIFAPSVIGLIERISYINSTIGWLNQHNQITYTPQPGSGIALTYISDGDSNGAFYYLGTTMLTTAFTNPVTNGVVDVLASSIGVGTPNTLTDRYISDFYTNNTPNDWVAWDFKTKQISTQKYTLRNRNNGGGYYMRSWVLEGTNTLSAFNLAGINAGTWTPIDTRNNDTFFNASNINAFYTLTSNGSQSSYRYLRYRSIGLDSSANNFLCMGEFEFYGNLI